MSSAVDSIDADKIKAAMRDGVLTLVAPTDGAPRSKAFKIPAAKSPPRGG
jgi:HSP20 family molecular chaperone IbpA